MVHYKATAGTLPLFDEASGDVKARIFFVSYERLEPEPSSSLAQGAPEKWVAADPTTRPVTFCFNGGPGSSSVWLHLGAWGPKRVAMGDAGALLPPPWQLR